MPGGIATLTFVHVALSLVAIVSGLVAMYGLLAARPMDGWVAFFLATTVATSVTGFFFPVDHFMPSHAIGIISLVALAAAILARYVFRLAGAWRTAYVVGAVAALYFNVFVLIAQAFRKVPALKALAPTQSEPPFLVAQIVCLALFVILGIVAVKKFRGATADMPDRGGSPTRV